MLKFPARIHGTQDPAWIRNCEEHVCVCIVKELAEDCLSLCDGGAGLGLEKEPEALELAAILRNKTMLRSISTSTRKLECINLLSVPSWMGPPK